MKSSAKEFTRDYVKQGDILEKKGNIATATDYYLQAIQAAPGYWRAHARLRRQLESFDLDEEVLNRIAEVYRKLIQQIEKNDPGKNTLVLLYTGLGNVISKQGKINDARDCYQKACYVINLKENPQFVKKHWNFDLKGQKPNFIVFGSMRCGSSSLYKYLVAHPKIIQGLQKETWFFTRNFNEGKKWYFSHFPPLPENQGFITGEATVSYLYYNLVPKRIAKVVPNIKLIAILRNPVDRAISQYHHWVKLGLETKSLTETLASNLEEIKRILKDNEETKSKQTNYLLSSVYIHYLKPWLAIFPREQLLVIPSEELFMNPRKTMNQIYEFLGVPGFELKKYDIYNATSYKSLDEEKTRELKELFQPYNQELEDCLGVKINWNSGM
ncbi:MAG: sulfotransferase domain-containing protein [Gomphosphaeria aponina SAG 52.96 = DSM 107014]|uniref:Sulfotransferase domain-containing protein n=1 Tax=Gomphosphaeria aponina SAG 52.96 = DSM 107014 TaxID=1521640 RepID=A0A941GVI0_9CHRO|nr:sulfotransferase domain-containing protein [Gomphosphaeria aponina SAG 52.96 = DSM 107014]